MLLALLLPLSLLAQESVRSYRETDQYAMQVGTLAAFNVAQITDTLTRPFSDKRMKARAIFTWICHYIDTDPKATRTQDTKFTRPEEVILRRKSTPLGIAQLFQEMCSQAHIRCLVVDGFVKNSTEDIGEIPEAPNHSWNVVQLGQSPDQWHYVDACRGGGTLDRKFSQYTRDFQGAQFFADRSIFNLEHYPDNAAWRLGSGPASLKDFYRMPLVGKGAYTFGVTHPEPVSGKIFCKPNTPFTFSFQSLSSIQELSISVSDGKKPAVPERVNLKHQAEALSCTYSFRKEGSFQVTLMHQEQPLLSWSAEISE